MDPAEFTQVAARLERHYSDVQDLEFTIENGRLWMLQTRSGKRTALAAVKIAADMVAEGILTKAEALGRIEPAHVDQLLRDQYDPALNADGLAQLAADFRGYAALPDTRVVLVINSALLFVIGLMPGMLMTLCSNAILSTLGT